MPFALLLIGFLAFVSAYKNTLPQLGALLKSDFSGKGNFLYWIAALIIVGGVGYFRPLQNSSKMLLLLVLVVMVLSDKGFFGQFVAALNAPAPAAATETAVGSASNDAAAPASSGGGGLLGTISSIAKNPEVQAAVMAA